MLHVDKQGRIINLADEAFIQLREDCDYVLFDGLEGGSGETITTTCLAEIAKGYNHFIAGGLSEQNVSEIIANCRPYAVDISSGVENQLGHKDLNLIKRFINKVTTAGVNP